MLRIGRTASVSCKIYPVAGAKGFHYGINHQLGGFEHHVILQNFLLDGNGCADYFFDMIDHIIFLEGPGGQTMVHKLIGFTMSTKIAESGHHFEFWIPGTIENHKSATTGSGNFATCRAG